MYGRPVFEEHNTNHYQSSSPTLREDCRQRFFENRMLRRIFGPKRDEVTAEGR
jgi:hypothetical protein